MNHLTRTAATVLLLFRFILNSNLAAQNKVTAQDKASWATQRVGIAKPTDLPPPIYPFMKIRAYDHPGIGTYIVGLGDVNGDGFGDFAVSSTLDTTFIFFGGPNLDDKPDAIVLGGGSGIASGDYNGDGYPDIITSQLDWYHRDLEIKGLVRIYLNTGTPPFYRTQPDFEIRGKNKFSGLAVKYGWLKGGDVNGDGKLDLLIESPNDKTPNGRGILYLYLGNTNPDTIPDFQFMDTHGGEIRDIFGEKFIVEDLNQDGFDDIIVQGIKAQGNVVNLEVHLGNAQAQFGAPYKDITNYQDYYNPFQLVDIDGNNCLEIFRYSREAINPPFAWGKCDVDFPSQTFMPDTTFPNPLPDIFGWGMNISSIGKYNTTGYGEYVILWAVTPIIDGVSCWLYQSGPGWQTKAIAYYGLRVLSDNVGGPYPLGDVTGDNLDDFALISDAYSPDAIRYWAPVWLYKGDKQYKITGENMSIESDAFSLSVFPNPVTSFDTKQVYVQGILERPTTIELSIVDVLGKEHLSMTKQFDLHGAFQIPIGIERLSQGQYFIVLKFKEARGESSTFGGEQKIIVKPLVLLTH